jgi:cytochrome c oxidase cbb3-type subunit 3
MVHKKPRALLTTALLTLATLPLSGCKREERSFRLPPPVAAALDDVVALPGGIGGRPPEVVPVMGNPWRSNAYQLAEGKRLFEGFGCQQCHGDGEGKGDSGPSLIDGWWNYGADLVSIHHSIRDGRPGGMPAFRSRLTNDQLWQLTGYVQQLGAYSGGAAAPGRSDRRQHRPAENRAPARFAPLQP